MQINIAGHHVEVTDGIRESVNNKFKKIASHYPSLDSISVTLTTGRSTWVRPRTPPTRTSMQPLPMPPASWMPASKPARALPPPSATTGLWWTDQPTWHWLFTVIRVRNRLVLWRSQPN